MTNRSREQSGNELSRLSSVPRLHWPATLGRFRLPAQSCVARKTRSSDEFRCTTDWRTRHGLLSHDQRGRHDWHWLCKKANEVQDTFRRKTIKVGRPVEWDVDRYQDQV